MKAGCVIDEAVEAKEKKVRPHPNPLPQEREPQRPAREHEDDRKVIVRWRGHAILFRSDLKPKMVFEVVTAEGASRFDSAKEAYARAQEYGMGLSVKAEVLPDGHRERGAR